LGGEPFYGLTAGVAGFVGVEGEHRDVARSVASRDEGESLS
jgi:hypothetical protein